MSLNLLKKCKLELKYKYPDIAHCSVLLPWESHQSHHDTLVFIFGQDLWHRTHHHENYHLLLLSTHTVPFNVIALIDASSQH